VAWRACQLLRHTPLIALEPLLARNGGRAAGRTVRACGTDLLVFSRVRTEIAWGTLGGGDFAAGEAVGAKGA
jgi:hypothetical protein